MIKAYLTLAIGALCCSQAVIFIKLSTVHPALLTALRCLIAAAVLLPLYQVRRRQVGERYRRRDAWHSILPGVLFSLHLLTWTYGSRLTSVAHAMLIINMTPLFMPVVLALLIRERVRGYEMLGTAIAMTGIVTLTLYDQRTEGASLWGDLWCLVSTLCSCVYMALARRNRHVPSVWLYLPPLYLTAGVVAIAVLPLMQPTWPDLTWEQVLWVVCLALIPTVLGHSFLNAAMRELRGQVVAIANLSQIGFAGVVAWLIFEEVPQAAFYVALVFVLGGIGLTVSASLRQRRAFGRTTVAADAAKAYDADSAEQDGATPATPDVEASR